MNMENEPDPTAPQFATEMPAQESRHWALAAHIAGLLAGNIVPFGGILSPMVIWLVRREKDPFAGDHALEAMNFQITVALAAIASVILVFVGIGILLLIALVIANLVLSILAAVAAAEGRPYRYPWTLRFVTG